MVLKLKGQRIKCACRFFVGPVKSIIPVVFESVYKTFLHFLWRTKHGYVKFVYFGLKSE